jgi:hypothetical protein
MLSAGAAHLSAFCFVVVQEGKCFQNREAAFQFQNFGTGSVHAMRQRMQSRHLKIIEELDCVESHVAQPWPKI